MSRTFSLSCLCAVALAIFVPMHPASARQQNQYTKSAPPENPPHAKPSADAVPKKSIMAQVEDLEQKGFLQRPQVEMSYGKRGLTRYEIAVVVQRMAAGMRVRTLSQDGTKLEYTFGIPGNLEVQQAQEMLDLWVAFGKEIKSLGVELNTYQRISKTLEVYISTSSPSKK